jgi:outer membrane protein OmpA-like peptidoglycan-associated protein
MQDICSNSTSKRTAFHRRALPVIALVLGAALPALAQTSSSQSGSGEGYSIYEFNPFGGYQHFLVPNRDGVRTGKFDGAGVIGARVGADWWNYAGVEASFTAGFNRFLIQPLGLTQNANAPSQNYTLAVNPMFYFTPRESKLRPYATVGGGLTWYTVGKTLNTSNVPTAVGPPNPLENKFGPALIYAFGVKYNISRDIGLRFEFRGMRTQDRAFGLPGVPYGPGSIYFPAHSSENAFIPTGGITIRFGHHGEPAPPVVIPKPIKPPEPKPVANIRINGITGAGGAVCPGEGIRLTVDATGWLPDQTPAYQWIVNGGDVSGATSPSFSVPTQNSSVVTVRVSAPGSSQTSNPVAVTVRTAGPPTVQFTLSQTSIAYGARLPLNATATPGQCGGPASLRYSASEGTISGNVFDSSTVAFDLSNRLKQQTKVIHLTATATDEKGGRGSATADLTVTLNPEARRLDDIIFPANSARVNNCAKRLLMETLTPMLRDDPSATVILIGHRDEREKGKNASKLDRVRTLNAAAVLSAGVGICPMLELSRVKVNWAGTDQSSATKPLFCGTSTDVKERSGQTVKSTDPRAQFRRVEVWIVPGGAAMPAGISGLQEVPAAEVKKLGCPK